MPTWIEVQEKHGGGAARGRKPLTNKVRYRPPEGGRRNGEIFVSHDLIPDGATHAAVLTDGNGRLAVKIGSTGSHKVTFGRGLMGKFAVRRTVADFLPNKPTDISFTREGDLIVIDTAQFKDPA